MDRIFEEKSMLIFFIILFGIVFEREIVFRLIEC